MNKGAVFFMIVPNVNGKSSLCANMVVAWGRTFTTINDKPKVLCELLVSIKQTDGL